MPLHWIALAQGLYFLLTGLWPLVHLPSFLAVTGPKHDLWLVRTVGAVVAPIGLALAVGGYRQEITPPLVLLGLTSAAALMSIDLVYVLRRTIPPIYLADAAAEAALILAWVIAMLWR